MFHQGWEKALLTTPPQRLDRRAPSSLRGMKPSQQHPTGSEPPYEAVLTTSAALPAIPLSARVVLPIGELNILIRVPNARTQFQF